jgi:voltage-dependent calcium channel T type alpha-1G
LANQNKRPLSSYYKVQETEKDYICSLAKDSGMHTCSSLPPTKSDGRFCNDSVVPGIPVGMDGLSVNGSCINWNQYYTDCRAGEKNPFQGAISFDNIGLAWVAIFLVSFSFRFFLFFFYLMMITNRWKSIR